MNSRLLFYVLVLVLSIEFVLYELEADVLFESSDASAIADSLHTQLTVGIGSGQVGDFVVLSCSTRTENGSLATTFNNPNPGEWNLITQGGCAFDACFQGIWGGFTNNEGSQDITCSWTEDSWVSAGGSLRFSNVDPENSIIDFACNIGEFGEIISPSIETEAGSQVVRIYTFALQNDVIGSPDITIVEANENLWFGYAENENTSGDVVFSQGTSEFSAEAGPTGEEQLENPTIQIGGIWRACTIALRMVPEEPRDVPTMSEWGLISFAAFAGIAGFWFIRRRQLAA